MDDKQPSFNQLFVVVALLVSFVASFRVEEQDTVYFTNGHNVLRNPGLSHRAKTTSSIDFNKVEEDLIELLTNSQESWPADYGNYGPLFVRLAWHNAGSYRSSDGRGGVDGGRQRFDPERSWEDNTNLDKARSLLWPIKQKYGLNLSWGDLIVLSGNAAIKSMGGPILGFCGGRIDDSDGSESGLLGPTPEQDLAYPCDPNGACKKPLGPTTIGLIYLNPEGPMGQPIPEVSSNEVRDTFGRMNMNDSETVALIGGGHSFGKAHGACPSGPGPSPKEDPENPWPGNCGTGKGEDTYTSGFEFPWTTTPTKWNTEFFQNLINFKWKVEKGPGDKHQWHVDGPSPSAPSADQSHQQNIGMLTTDVSLLRDPKYFALVESWATDQEGFNHAFSHAWYKLTARDMGPVTRCIGDDIPPPQDWQFPLPSPSDNLADFDKVRMDLNVMLDENNMAVGMFSRLAWQCTSTFRSTDYLGGCNGARIRFSPQKDWPVNTLTDNIIDFLMPIKEKYGVGLSWADLIVLAGNVAIERSGGKAMHFCPGRTDAEDGEGSTNLFPRITGQFNESSLVLHEFINLMGLTPREYATLHGAGYVIGQVHDCDGLYCRRDAHNPIHLQHSMSNKFFTTLLSEEWEEYTVPNTGKQMYKAVGKFNLFMYKVDLQFKYDAELLSIAQDYASDNELFLNDFAIAWTKLANADRFDGPTSNICGQ